jgi:predicted amidohydrolase
VSARDRVLGGHDCVRVAIVQTAPVFLDLDRSIDKACAKIAAAAAGGARLVVFSETWLAGYPYWDEGWNSQAEAWMEVRERFFDNALLVPSAQSARLCEAAAAHQVTVAIGCNELDSKTGSHTIYNTLLYIGSDGKVIGKHRKLMPTFVEAAFWGQGDGRDLHSHATAIGRIGGLICGEHVMTLARARMIQQGEDFHIAVYPGAFNVWSGPRLQVEDPDGSHFIGYASCRAHANEAGAFVICAVGYIDAADIPADFPMRDSLNIEYARGGSMVVAPAGMPLVGPVYGDTIVYADCPAQMIKISKAIIDTNGHYARPDVLELVYHPDSAPAAGLVR